MDLTMIQPDPTFRKIYDSLMDAGFAFQYDQNTKDFLIHTTATHTRDPIDYTLPFSRYFIEDLKVIMALFNPQQYVTDWFNSHVIAEGGHWPAAEDVLEDAIMIHEKLQRLYDLLMEG